MASSSNLGHLIYLCNIRVLNQRNSYRELQLPPDVFQRLMALYNVITPFLKFVHGFGYRQNASDDFFSTYHCRYSDPADVVVEKDHYGWSPY